MPGAMHWGYGRLAAPALLSVSAAFRSSLALLIRLGRIILKKLGHGFLQGLVVLVRIFIELDSLADASAPDQMLNSGVEKVYQQGLDAKNRSLAR